MVLSCVAKQIESTGRLSNALAVAAALQLVYIFKFFCWESGYFNTLDVMHYRFGFRNFWGVTSWLPAIYAIVPLYLAGHPGDLPSAAALGILAFGLAAIWLNYDADVQRQRVRATGGNTTVWGRKPAVLPASYQTSDGARHQTVLLVAGWWGLARHFHYVPEMMIAVSWTLPAGFDHALPWFYVVYLIMLLMHRAAYDDRRCLEKYGHIWEVYCARVPYRVIPFAY
ncbi:steroid 5-alpha reductase family enzyme [Bradyrhizobium diazoefficiens]